MPKGISIFNDIFKNLYDKGIHTLFVDLIWQQEKPLSFKTLICLLEMCKPCSEYIAPIDHDA